MPTTPSTGDDIVVTAKRSRKDPIQSRALTLAVLSIQFESIGDIGGGTATPQNSMRPRLTCDGIPGFAAYQQAAISAIAENPVNSYTPAWLRGIFIHVAFSRLVAEIPGSSVNVSYKDGQVAGWLDFDSVRPDAVDGLLNSPNFVVELKTSNARLVNPQLSRYYTNLPPKTRICEIYEQGM